MKERRKKEKNINKITYWNPKFSLNGHFIKLIVMTKSVHQEEGFRIFCYDHLRPNEEETDKDRQDGTVDIMKFISFDMLSLPFESSLLNNKDSNI